jgi:hypothetical protein
MPDDQHPERCLECEQEVTDEIVSAEEVFINLHMYRQPGYANHGVRVGTAAYCVHCWMFQEPKKPLQREADPEYLRPQWDQLNQRSRWYTQQTWQGPFAFVTVASIAGYNLAKTDGVSAIIQALGFLLLTLLGIGVGVFLHYVGQGVDSSIRQMMRIELHPKFLRSSALEGARDPGGFVRLPLPFLRQHRVLAGFITWSYTALLSLAMLWFFYQGLREIFR